MINTTPNSSSDLPSVNMVSEGTEIIGTLITKNDVRIAGTVDGEAKSDGKVIVASSGHINGNINATSADIAGRVEGEVHVTGKLILRQSAVVECDIYTQNLVVEEGATFNGACHMREFDPKTENKSTNKGDNKSKPSSASLSEDDLKEINA